MSNRQEVFSPSKYADDVVADPVLAEQSPGRVGVGDLVFLAMPPKLEEGTVKYFEDSELKDLLEVAKNPHRQAELLEDVKNGKNERYHLFKKKVEVAPLAWQNYKNSKVELKASAQVFLAMDVLSRLVGGIEHHKAYVAPKPEDLTIESCEKLSTKLATSVRGNSWRYLPPKVVREGFGLVTMDDVNNVSVDVLDFIARKCNIVGYMDEQLRGERIERMKGDSLHPEMSLTSATFYQADFILEHKRLLIGLLFEMVDGNYLKEKCEGGPFKPELNRKRPWGFRG
jgi:hypothetical protein